VYVWENFIQKAPARRIDIVAHSYGGIVTVHLVTIVTLCGILHDQSLDEDIFK
jgi:esterase/lipase superfamily enzyme